MSIRMKSGLFAVMFSAVCWSFIFSAVGTIIDSRSGDVELVAMASTDRADLNDMQWPVR